MSSTNNEIKQTESQPATDRFIVDPQTFLQLTIAKIDRDIASTEVVKAEADLRIAELKKEKMQALLDHNLAIVKAQNEQKNKEKQAESTSSASVTQTPEVPVAPASETPVTPVA
ncbi:MAG: hypothetical protein Q7R33_06085 [Nitrosarchaeum sp.]|nr:hypothetical protein [Nitrosarchaeum sp.]